uniref:Ovule protein n=1 Tax=Heterorhabditis bacteriophora TaxID=37862 RepID=A0A1I7WYC0_HETBA
MLKIKLYENRLPICNNKQPMFFQKSFPLPALLWLTMDQECVNFGFSHIDYNYLFMIGNKNVFICIMVIFWYVSQGRSRPSVYRSYS